MALSNLTDRVPVTTKSPNAFRTISEVAMELELPQHVLRFWESKFNQVKPLKRGGNRRYYRPEDIGLLKKIRSLLYEDGYTIKGVQKLLRETTKKKRSKDKSLNMENVKQKSSNNNIGAGAVEEAIEELNQLKALLQMDRK